MKWEDWLTQARVRLMDIASSSPKREAEILLEKVTGAARARIIAFSETILEEKQHFLLETLLLRREQGEPIAYLIGEREFWSLPLLVSIDTFIPRPDTEHLVDRALSVFLKDSAKVNVLDLGTGGGAISLALAYARKNWKITGVDNQTASILLARENAIRLQLKNVTFLLSDWFSPCYKERYHIIVSNPPYLDARDPYLSQGDVRFEPRSALISENNGLSDLEAICQHSRDYLICGGWLMMEHGWKQGRDVRALFYCSGFKNIATFYDYSNHERVTQGQWVSS